MQGYSYSVFSIAALVIHLIINFRLLAGRGESSLRAKCYRGFLLGVIFYYAVDGAWGIFAGLGWVIPWYCDTVLFFLSLVTFAVMWCRFSIVYLELGKWATRVLTWFGYAILAANVVLLTANFFNDCVFSFDAQDKYITGWARDPLIALLIAFNLLNAGFVLAKAVSGNAFNRRRGMMVLLSCLTMMVSILLQIAWPLTPFTALGCLICTCFFHIFVIQDEQSAKHTAELEQALARARAAEKSRSMFFSIVSHDIRTPLNAILGYSELLQDGIPDQAKRNEALKSIRDSGTMLLQLVNDVLDLSRMESGKITLNPRPVRLEQLVDAVFSSFGMSASAKGIELVNHTIGLPVIMVDEHRFKQILFNLVGNAVKFTDHGSVIVAAACNEANLELAVSDSGCGIPPDMLTRVLEPFVQVQDPSHAADRANGTGLGLSICRSLTEAMGGRLSVKSELGKGSTFSVCIPGVVGCTMGAAQAPDPAPAPAPLPTAASIKLPQRVLVVDDSSVNRAVLSALLKRAGIASIRQACDGEEALIELDAASKAGSPRDFVFTDFWMPKMNGTELIRRIRADPRFRRLPVFAVTADTEFRGDARTNLFDGVLFKPLTYDKLMTALTTSHPA